MSRRLSGLVAGLAFLSAPAVFAHDTWLLPSRFEVAPGATIAFELTSGMKFPEPESPVAPDRIAASGVRLTGRTVTLDPQTPTKGALRLSAGAPAAGVATIWVASRPRSLSLTPDQVKHHLEEIGAPPSVEARWRQQQRFRESYSKIAKTYVKVGDAPADRSWQEPAGLPLEFVPLQDPTALTVGSDFAVRLVRGGKPLADFAVSALAPQSGQWVTSRTDRDGQVSFKLNRPGPWLLRGTLIEESAAPETDWESVFTTLSVSVAPAAGR
jgi:uncharacterized GH25 family protein